MATTSAAVRAMWALGDYHRFATATVWELGPVLVNACGASAGQRVLDVAAGTGNVAIRAALAGASVVASDVTPENFDARRASISNGSKGTQRRFRSATESSMSSPRASVRCSRRTTRPPQASSCESVVPAV
jgi:ubiquinone/menaquinone biosynthesis C-methylase UbiE